MRKVKGLIWMMMMAVALTACSSSDDEENVPLTINTLSGEYIGEATGTLVSINEKGEQRSSDVTPQGTETAKITVNDDGTLTLRQPTFYVGKGAYPGAIIYNIPAKLANNVITFSIKDYGNGIDDNDMPFIFEKFYRGNNSKEKQGTGLGLYIVKYMMEKMNGKVELENKNGLIVKLFFKKIIN
jgi:signal transduction histidine kinase